MKNRKILIFTDLDGSMLHRETFMFDEVKEFVKEFDKNDLIIIPNTSKTQIEIENFLEELDISCPYISENGSSIHMLSIIDQRLPNEIVLSRKKEEILEIFDRNIESNLKFKCQFVNNLSNFKKIEILGLPKSKINDALNRKYTLPFKFTGTRKEKEYLFNQVLNLGLKIQEGDRVLNLGDEVSKGLAIKKFISYLDKDDIVTIGIGDSSNDIDMLEVADFPCLIKNNESNFNGFKNKNYIRSSLEAPSGWVEVVRLVLTKLNYN